MYDWLDELASEYGCDTLTGVMLAAVVMVVVSLVAVVDEIRGR